MQHVKETSIFSEGKSSKNPEPTATEFEDGRTKYEGKDAHNAGIRSHTGESVFVNTDNGKKLFILMIMTVTELLTDNTDRNNDIGIDFSKKSAILLQIFFR